MAEAVITELTTLQSITGQSIPGTTPGEDSEIALQNIDTNENSVN